MRMKVYTTDRIRNVVVLGHGGSGKTSLVEALAYHGRNYQPYWAAWQKEIRSAILIKKRSNVNFQSIHLWCRLSGAIRRSNILDTPGYFDFVGEAEEAASAADAAIIVVSGKNGVEVGTQKAWALCEKYKLPRMFYVSNMDVR